MDTRVPADHGPASPAARADDALERRLASLEARLDELDETIRDVLPAACRQAVEQELEGLGAEVRRAVSELGRLLLRDLDRLTKLLADHRDTIVERLSEPFGDTLPEPSPPTSPPAEPSPPPPDAAAGDPPPEGSPASPLTGEEGRWRVLPGRRRSPRRHRGGDDAA